MGGGGGRATTGGGMGTGGPKESKWKEGRWGTEGGRKRAREREVRRQKERKIVLEQWELHR